MSILKTTFIFILFHLLSLPAFAQTHQIALVKPDGTTTIHNTFQSAYDAAEDDDHIYLPGGTFNLGNFNLDKRLHIYGVGWDPDACKETGITILNYWEIHANASGGSFTGIKSANLALNGVIGFTSKNCYFENGVLILYNNSSNISLLNCYIGTSSWFDGSFYLYSANVTNFLLSNCIIMSHFGGGGGGYGDAWTIVNNILFKQNVQLSPNSTFLNNIFKDGCSTSNSMFYNNTNVTVQNNNNNIYNNNVTESWPDIFVDTGPEPYDYNKDNDYHVKTSSECHNSGSDGSDRGIYGGPFPWTPGSVPPNPHIISRAINSATDANGNLQINVNVRTGD